MQEIQKNQSELQQKNQNDSKTKASGLNIFRSSTESRDIKNESESRRQQKKVTLERSVHEINDLNQDGAKSSKMGTPRGRKLKTIRYNTLA